ncbi:hypothetical protein, partial [uncultured Duncaniella sp.]|uniref:hypothetical protein n=1 Tax=uncultured Duncaniella sp. TaxID=2768039 RepID=UPI00263134E6
GGNDIHFPHTPSRHAITPCGLHCVAARCGAMIASLLRSFPIAIRQGDDAKIFRRLLIRSGNAFDPECI